MALTKYQTIKKFAAESGYTENAIRSKIYDGTWQEGEVWIRAPDDKRLISVEGYNQWVESAAGCAQRQRQVLRSVSCSTGHNGASVSRLSPAPLI